MATWDDLTWRDLTVREKGELIALLYWLHLEEVKEGAVPIFTAARMIADEVQAAQQALHEGLSVVLDRGHSARERREFHQDAFERYGKPTPEGGRILEGNIFEALNAENPLALWRDHIRARVCALVIRENRRAGEILLHRQGLYAPTLPNGVPLAWPLAILERLETEGHREAPPESTTQRRQRLAVAAAQRLTAAGGPQRDDFKSGRPGRPQRGIPMALREAVAKEVAHLEGMSRPPSLRTVERWLADGGYVHPMDLRFPALNR